MSKEQLLIFNDTAKLLVYTQRGVIDVGFTLGQYCEMAYKSTIEERNTEAKEPDIKTAVNKFIKNNAKFPITYEPIDYTGFTWGGSGNEIFYEIKHQYKIKQNDGIIVSVQNYFILDKDFEIMIIESQRSGIIKVDPPRIEDWMKTYGKN